MAVVEELLRSEVNGNISFGNHKLAAKAKLEDFESVPGTSVCDFCEKEDIISFTVEGDQDAQITIGLSDDTEYEIIVAGESAGVMKTNLSGKLNISVELEGMGQVEVKLNKK